SPSKTGNSGRTRSHIDGSRTFFFSFHVKLDLLSFHQGVKIESLKAAAVEAAAVEEDLPSIVAMDEPEPAAADDFLNRSLHIWTSRLDSTNARRLLSNVDSSGGPHL